MKNLKKEIVKKAKNKGYNKEINELDFNVIFSHDFAIAYFGKNYWRSSLQEMVLQVDPIKYLERFL